MLQPWSAFFTNNNSGEPARTRPYYLPPYIIIFLEIVGEVRKKLSIATAELSRIKENRKLTKRGKKNRSLLQKECRSLSASSLVSYIEKQKSLLRKLKVSFGRKRRQEEAKVLNRQFKEDPGRVYATITMMAEEDPDNARPKYKVA